MYISVVSNINSTLMANLVIIYILFLICNKSFCISTQTQYINI